MTDEQILELINHPKRRDQGYRLLVEQYQERLYWHIRRLVVDHDDANDVVQNCFIKVFKGIKNFKGQSKLYTWLYRIATNEAITFLNKRKNKTTQPIDDGEIDLANKLKADPYFDGDETEIALKKALAVLPDKQKVVFNLRYYEEMGYHEMSEILGTSVGALKASYHHAIKKIEKYFQEVEI